MVNLSFEFTDLIERLNIQHIRATAYKPSSNVKRECKKRFDFLDEIMKIETMSKESRAPLIDLTVKSIYAEGKFNLWCKILNIKSSENDWILNVTDGTKAKLPFKLFEDSSEEIEIYSDLQTDIMIFIRKANEIKGMEVIKEGDIACLKGLFCIKYEPNLTSHSIYELQMWSDTSASVVKTHKYPNQIKIISKR